MHHDHRQVGEVVKHFVELFNVLWPTWHTRSNDSAVDADWNIEFTTRGVDRVHLLVADADLRNHATGEGHGSNDVVLSLQAFEVANRFHSLVGIGLSAQVKAPRIFGLGANRVLVYASHALFDVERVHLFDDPSNDIGIGRHNIGDVFKHVLRREFHFLQRFVVFQVRFEEVICGLLLFDARERESHTEIHDADICRHSHDLSPCGGAPIR